MLSGGFDPFGTTLRVPNREIFIPPSDSTSSDHYLLRPMHAPNPYAPPVAVYDSPHRAIFQSPIASLGARF
jgi:hypothetical protein